MGQVRGGVLRWSDGAVVRWWMARASDLAGSGVGPRSRRAAGGGCRPVLLASSWHWETLVPSPLSAGRACLLCVAQIRRLMRLRRRALDLEGALAPWRREASEVPR